MNFILMCCAAQEIIRNPVNHTYLIKHVIKLTQNDQVYYGQAFDVNDTFTNISAISWLSVLLVEETGVPGENHRPAASH